MNGKAVRVADPAQESGVVPVGDPGDLGGGEGDDFIPCVITEIGVEGMKIPSRRPHDEYTLDCHTALPFHCPVGDAGTPHLALVNILCCQLLCWRGAPWGFIIASI
jgi:hypothetical protein